MPSSEFDRQAVAMAMGVQPVRLTVGNPSTSGLSKSGGCRNSKCRWSRDIGVKICAHGASEANVDTRVAAMDACSRTTGQTISRQSVSRSLGIPK
jgi:hypothetical protein